MPTSPAPGATASREVAGTFPPTPRPEIDQALSTLAAKKDEWAALPVRDRRAILTELLQDFARIAPAWADACREAEGIAAGTALAGEEWLAGPYFVLRNLRLLGEALADIENHGRPRIPGPVRTRPDGQVTAEIFPASIYDRLFYRGITAEVWMEPGVDVSGLAATQAIAYRERQPQGKVALVMSAGNVSSIGPTDTLYKLFVENQVVIYKTHPLNAYLGPLFEEGLQALFDWGFLRQVHGGAEVGGYLCEHPRVDEIHITGSDKTVEAIVFGPGEEGQRRKAERRPKLDKPISSELGNVSPVIVVPGPWSPDDFAYQAENLAAMLVNNAGFNCNATRVIVQHASWPGRQTLLDGLRRQLAQIPPRRAWYSGADERWAKFRAAHPDDLETYGEAEAGMLPWGLVAGLDPAAEDEICFHTEAFCGLTPETGLAAAAVPEFLARAVDFANERLWGTLNVTLLVHPASLRQPAVAEAFERALGDLRYGTVSVNNWAAIGFGLITAPWGAYPGHDLYDIQSGNGVVHNTLMFSRPQKTVIRSPFRMNPKPPWFPGHRTALELASKLTRFEADPSPAKLPGIFWEALRG